MADDQVTIDPEFLPSPPRIGQSRWLRFGALAAAAFILGWLLRSPTTGATNTTEAAPSTTAPTRETTSSTRPSSTTTTTVFAMAGLEVPLGEAVPGFADTITVAVSGGLWGEEVDVVRWRSSQAAPETIVSFREDSPDDWGWFVGLDAAGTWYAVQDEYGVLSVRVVAVVVDDYAWWAPPGEAVGLRVVDAAWHDTAPDRLAWLSCPRTPDGPGTLYALDVADRFAEPVPVTLVPDACGEFATWINQWGDWGFALERMGDWAGEDGREEGHTWTVLLNPGGVELAQLENGPGGAYMVAAGPAGTVWTEEPIEGAPVSFLLSLDGQQRNPVPGLAEGEWVEQAQWSPDGSRIALVLSGSRLAHPAIRVVDAATGEPIAEIDELGPDVFQTRWSSNGHFLLVGHDRDDEGPAGVALVVYDTATAAIAIEAPFRELHYFTEIRTFKPDPTAVQLTPVEWEIAVEDAAVGIHTLDMIVEVRPWLPDQVEDLSGRLVWDETVVDLCGIGIRDGGADFVHIGDIFQTTEGCGSNPTAMQEAFDEFGLPETGCVAVTVGGLNHEYCAPLS